MTVLFGVVVHTVKDTAAKAKFLFNSNPQSTVCCQEGFPARLDQFWCVAIVLLVY